MERIKIRMKNGEEFRHEIDVTFEEFITTLNTTKFIRIEKTAIPVKDILCIHCL